jgi:hypothetical protein
VRQATAPAVWSRARGTPPGESTDSRFIIAVQVPVGSVVAVVSSGTAGNLPVAGRPSGKS